MAGTDVRNPRRCAEGRGDGGALIATKDITGTVASAGLGTGPGAAGDAVRAATAGLGGRARLVLLFPSEDVEPGRAATEAVAAAPGAVVAGMTTSGSVPSAGGAPAHCAAIALDGTASVGVGVAEGASAGLRAAARRAAAAAMAGVADAPGQPLLLLFVDAGAGDQSDAVAGAYEVTGPAVPFAGGGAPVRHGAQFAPDGAGSDRVVAVMVRWPGPVGVGTAHSWHPRPTPAIVTRAKGRVVTELDGRPAAEAYLEALGVTTALADPDFEDFAALHPLGQPELHGEVRLRHVTGRTPEGGLSCVTAIPPNAAVLFGEQTPAGIVASVADAAREARVPLGDAPPRAALAFDCAGRKRAVGDLLGAEIEAIVAGVGGEVPLAGGFTHGEIGRNRGAKGDRNHAIVVVALG